MENKFIKPLLIIGGVVLIIILILINTYNGLVKAEEEVNDKYSSISTDLQRRADLIPNLVETVKAYADHEEDIFLEIATAREDLLNAGNAGELADAETNLNNAVGRLLAISEAYPELKANENFIQLQDELAGSENRIAVSRKDYNDAVKVYNTKVKSFPTNMLAGMFGFDEKEYFEVEEGSTNVPDIDFE